MAADSTKFIVITGVSRGLGRALARGFAALGHTVAGCGRSRSELDQLRDELGAKHDLAVVDVTLENEVQDWAQRLLKSFRPPDLLLNNAAVINVNDPLWRISAAEFSYVVDVNLKGVANVVRHFVPAMIKRRSGVIVNFSSGWGRSTSPEVAPYCASKWGIEGLTRALAQELPAGVAAVSLNPGIIDTDMLRSCFGSSAGEYPDPKTWARTSVPFLLALGPSDNGKALTAP